jgi:glycosyltransferase involved in cell wall biosynthesis
MKVLMITGDKRMLVPGTEANTRLELQRAQVEELKIVFWGRGSRSPLSVIWAAVGKKFDVVTVEDPFWRGLLGWIASRLCGARFNVQAHTDLLVQTLKRQHALAHFVLRRADSIRVVSQKIKEQVRQAGAVARIDILPVFVDLEKVAESPAADLKKEFPQFGKIVLYAGRLEEEKNPSGAIEAFAVIVKEFPGAGLLMAGSGSKQEELEDLVRNLGLAGKVIFLGYRTDVPSLYKAADVLLVASWHESWGASMVEALAAGCPVVAPDVGVAKEVGATVAERGKLAQAAIDVLKSGARGQLRLQLPDKEEWAKAWKQSLL